MIIVDHKRIFGYLELQVQLANKCDHYFIVGFFPNADVYKVSNKVIPNTIGNKMDLKNTVNF